MAYAATTTLRWKGAGSILDYPRLANLNNYDNGNRPHTFTRYGLVVSNLATAVTNSGVAALATRAPLATILCYIPSNWLQLAATNQGWNFSGSAGNPTYLEHYSQRTMEMYPQWFLGAVPNDGTSLFPATVGSALGSADTSVTVAIPAITVNPFGNNEIVLIDSGAATEMVQLGSAAAAATVSGSGTAGATITLPLATRGMYGSVAASHSVGTFVRRRPHMFTDAGGTIVQPFLNTSTNCPTVTTRFGASQRWCDYLASWCLERVLADGWDGFFFDNCLIDLVNTNSSVNLGSASNLNTRCIDGDNDNVGDSGCGSAGQGTAWRDGVVALVQACIDNRPDLVWMTNNALVSGLSHTNPQWPALSAPVGGGKEMEYASGDLGSGYLQSSSLPTPTPSSTPGWGSGWYGTVAEGIGNAALSTYSVLNADVGQPTGNSVPTTFNNSDTTLTISNMRFYAATALLGGAFFAFDAHEAGHGWTWAFEEMFDGVGTYLSAAVTTTPVAGTQETWTVFNNPAPFVAGDVLRVPSTTATRSAGQFDDERVSVVSVTGTSVVVKRATDTTSAAAADSNLAAPHPVGTRLFTDAQLAGKLGYLGQPTGPATLLLSPAASSIITNGAMAGTNGAAPANWSVLGTAGNGTFAIDTSPSVAPSTGQWLKVSTTTRSLTGQSFVYGVQQTLTSANFGTINQTLTFAFEAMSDHGSGRPLTIFLNENGTGHKQTFMVYPAQSGVAQTFYMTIQTPATLNSGASFNVQCATALDLGTIWLGNVRILSGDVHFWSRPFTGGLVLVNGTQSAQTATIPANVYRRIQGGQDTSGSNPNFASFTILTGTTLSVAAMRAQILVKL